MKTAQEWQTALDLDATPDAELLALLNDTAGMEAAPFTAEEALSAGLATELDPGSFEQEVENIYMAETVGAALSAVRGARRLAVREMARRLNVSGARIFKLEHGENAELATVARYATAAHYRVSLTLEPEGGGPVISVKLNGQDDKQAQLEQA